MDANTADLRDALDEALRWIERGEAQRALAVLNDVKLDAEDCAGTPPWAEWKVVFGEALSGMNNPDAEPTFDEALRRVGGLEVPNPTLEMRARAGLGKSLAQRTKLGRAREEYERARKIAERLGRPNDEAHYQLRIINADLRERKDPLLCAFQGLMSAGRDGYSYVHQLKAWASFTGDFALQVRWNTAMRSDKGKEAWAEYFRGILNQMKRDEGERDR
jgi:hypothetical protein